MTPPSVEHAALYRAVWRWHFYAALFVLPMVVLLSLTGALFLFKPQVERWEERAFHNQPVAQAVAPSVRVAAARASEPGSQFGYYRLPEQPGDAAMIHLRLPSGAMRDVFVSPAGQVLGQIDPEGRIIEIDRKIHGQLLLGRQGSWLVELAASWVIVMIATGLYLWWPRGRGPAGVIWPRLRHGRRAFWRDVHAVTGFWVSSLALVVLFTGLPWADAWGSAFKAVRHEMGWMKGPQDWTIGGKPADGGSEHAEHDHLAMAAPMAGMPGMAGMHHHPHAASFDPALFDAMVGHAQSEHLAFPAIVVPPGAPAGEGGKGRPAQGWVVKSDTQNRPLRVTLRYDRETGALRSREGLAGKHPIDQVLAYGIAWHEGQLLGTFNQLVGLATALMLLTLAVSGTVMWWRRKPDGALGAPPRFSRPGRISGAAWALVVFLLLWLPLFTLSLGVVLLLERLVLSRLPGTVRWFGTSALRTG